jgi:hypothetical protein
MPWSDRFDDPIPLPNSRPIMTLKNAADFIMALPKPDMSSEPWQIALKQLIDAAEGRNPIMHARIAILRALSHGKPAPAKPPRRKRAKAYRII